ncbi:MAG: chaperone NapD [Kiloniellaceae bacterium]
MAEATKEHHISSAVVSARPEFCQGVAERIASLPDTEVHYVAESKIVIVMEGSSQDAIGGRLTHIALMDHVLSANLVYEIVDSQNLEESCYAALKA